MTVIIAILYQIYEASKVKKFKTQNNWRIPRWFGRENGNNVARTRNCCCWPSSPGLNVLFFCHSHLIWRTEENSFCEKINCNLGKFAEVLNNHKYVQRINNVETMGRGGEGRGGIGPFLSEHNFTNGLEVLKYPFKMELPT